MKKRFRRRSLDFLFLALGICLLLVPCGAVSLRAADPPALPEAIRAVIGADRYRHAWWGLLVQDVQTGQILCALNPDRLFRPASVTKLFSAAAALEELGADYRFQTPLYISGKQDDRGNVRGDMILVAAGREVAFAFFVNSVHTTDVRGREETRRLTGETGADLLKIAEALYRAN